MLVCASEFARVDRERSAYTQLQISLCRENGTLLSLRRNTSSGNYEIVRERTRGDGAELVVASFATLDLALADGMARIQATIGRAVGDTVCPHQDASHAPGCRLWSGYDARGPKGVD